MSPELPVRAAAATHVGRVRTLNEDSYLTDPRLAMVADGMGGHAAGEVASALAVAAFAELGTRTPLRTEDVTGAVESANRAILHEVAAHPERQGMGTTVTAVALVDQGGAPHWLVVNVGDSRVYRVRAGRLDQLTVDHSEVAELIAMGRITPEQARTHPHRNVITRSVGTYPGPEADTWLQPVAADDLFLLCSDGLTGELTDAQISAIISAEPTLTGAAERLVAEAVAAGGRDNVTVVLLATPEGFVPDDGLENTASLPVQDLDDLEAAGS